DVRHAVDHWKAKGLDFSQILYQPPAPPTVARRCVRAQDHGLEKALDQTLISLCSEAIEHKTPVEFRLPIRNVNRTVGTLLGYEITDRKSTRLNSSHQIISYAVFCLKKKKT